MTLDEWMTQQGLNETALAAALGVAPSTVNRVRNGKQPPSPAFIAKCILASRGAIDAKTFFAAAYEAAA
jgi:transcriptional regulator with XRE-family HTH domain